MRKEKEKFQQNIAKHIATYLNNRASAMSGCDALNVVLVLDKLIKPGIQF